MPQKRVITIDQQLGEDIFDASIRCGGKIWRKDSIYRYLGLKFHDQWQKIRGGDLSKLTLYRTTCNSNGVWTFKSDIDDFFAKGFKVRYHDMPMKKRALKCEKDKIYAAYKLQRKRRSEGKIS